MTELVSVVVPVWNRGHCIAEALESVVAQAGVAVECVVVDDGSTDDTVAVIRSFADADDRVRLVEVDHGGPSPARNAGIAAARGDVVAFHDSDDLMPAGRLASQVAHLRSLDADGVFGRYVVDPVDGVALPGWMHGRPDAVAGWAWISLTVGRAALDAVGGFDEELRIGEDLDLIVRLRTSGCTIVAVDEVATIKRWFGDNLTYEIDEVGPATAQILRRHMARQRHG